MGEIYRTPLSGRLLYVNAINPETREICFSLGDNDCHDFANYNGIDAVSLIARPAVEGQQVWEEVTALDLAFPETILPESNKDKVKEK